MKAIVMSGGGMRCAYGVGVLQFLHEKFQYEPDILIGASGSTGTLAYYAANQMDSIVNIWSNLLSTPKFINKFRLSRIMDIDYLIDEVFRKQDALKTSQISSSAKLYVAATQLPDGNVKYFSNPSEILESLRASMAMPLAYNKHVRIRGIDYIDGALAASFEDLIQHALNLGATKVIAVDMTNKSHLVDIPLRLYAKLHPQLQSSITAYLNPKPLEENKKFLVIRPQSLHLGTLDNNQSRLKAAIARGYKDAFQADFADFV